MEKNKTFFHSKKLKKYKPLYLLQKEDEIMLSHEVLVGWKLISTYWSYVNQ